MSTLYTRTYRSPLGDLELQSDGTALMRIRLPEEVRPAAATAVRRADAAPFAAVVAQLDDYFAGTRRAFDLPLAPGGTAVPAGGVERPARAYPTAAPSATPPWRASWAGPPPAGPWGPPTAAIPCPSWCPATG